jgi:hypothetical protein
MSEKTYRGSGAGRQSKERATAHADERWRVEDGRRTAGLEVEVRVREKQRQRQRQRQGGRGGEEMGD